MTAARVGAVELDALTLETATDEYTVNLKAGLTEGNHLIVVACHAGEGTPPMLSTADGDFVKEASRVVCGSEAIAACWTYLIPASPVATLTLDNADANSSCIIWQIEVSGLDNADLVEISNFSQKVGGAATFDITSVTPTKAGCYGIAATSVQSAAEAPLDTSSSGTNWTLLAHEDFGNQGFRNAGIMFEQLQTTAQAANVVTIDGDNGNIEGAFFQIFFNEGIADADAPNLSLPTAASIDHRSVTIGATTDEANGTAHGVITAEGDQVVGTTSNAQVIAGTGGGVVFAAADKTISAATAFTFDALAVLTPGTTYGYAIVHVDAASNEDAGSRVEGTFTTDAAFAGSATFDGNTIPADSGLYITNGTHTAADHASTLTDSAASFVAGHVGLRVNNNADGSTGSVATVPSGTTLTTTLSGGSDDSWDQFDSYNLEVDIDINDIIYYQTSVSVVSEQYTYDQYIYDTTGTSYSAVMTVTVTATGAPDSSGTVSVSVKGVPTFTAAVGGGSSSSRRRMQRARKLRMMANG